MCRNPDYEEEKRIERREMEWKWGVDDDGWMK